MKEIVSVPWRTLVSTASGATALMAVGGAIALGTGSIDMGRDIESRMPSFASPLIAGTALFAVVAVPMAITAALAVFRPDLAPLYAVGSGALLIAWIALQIVVLGALSWLQPVMALTGGLVLTAGCLRPGRTQ